jgi:hypothetical protein
MKAQQLEAALAAADPVDRTQLARLDFAALEADLLADLDGIPSELPAAGSKRRRPRRLALTLAAASAATAVVAVLILAGGGSDRPSPAYAADLVRFAESTPLLLLEGPGWRVQDVTEYSGGDGSMEFVTGKPIPYETVMVTGNDKTGEHESGMFPASVRRRRVELSWRHGSLAAELATARGGPHPHGQRWVEAPVLGTTAQVDTRAEFYVNQGGPGNRQMTALWSEGGYVLVMRAAVPDLAAFEERLGWLRKVDSQTWLDAMPAKVVKAADHEAAVREMLEGIPVSKDFRLGLIPNEGLTTNRYQVGASVTGVVSCLWFRQWGEARRAHDPAKAAEAERAMATSRHWAILREMAREGAYPELIWELAAAMPSGRWQWAGHVWRLLPHAEGLGCARLGLPLLRWKQRRQREHGVPPPPE